MIWVLGGFAVLLFAFLLFLAVVAVVSGEVNTDD